MGASSGIGREVARLLLNEECGLHSKRNSDKEAIRKFCRSAGERNLTDDAYFVELNDFKTVYRLAVRLVHNYKKNIQFLALAAETDNDSDVEELKNLLKKILRKSDCITQSGKNEFYILLMETTTEEVKFVKGRILGKIKASDKISDLQINFRDEVSLS